MRAFLDLCERHEVVVGEVQTAAEVAGQAGGLGKDALGPMRMFPALASITSVQFAVRESRLAVSADAWGLHQSAGRLQPRGMFTGAMAIHNARRWAQPAGRRRRQE